jgi:mono/diheme cytochrome c family protein
VNVLADAPLSLNTSLWVVNIAGAVFLLGVAFAAVRERRRRAETPLNKEAYLDDEGLEGPRLERMGAWAVAMMSIVAISLPAYWLWEPTRQDQMEDQFVERSVEQGAALYRRPPEGDTVALGCAGCHGDNGEGGAAATSVQIDLADLEVAPDALNDQERQCAPLPDDDDTLLCKVAWKAPALNTVFKRFSRDEIVRIVTFGRPGTPMPAWGLAGGGAKNEQSVDNIVDFLESIQISDDEAREAQADVSDGRLLFQANCARCHTKHWSYAENFTKGVDVDLFVVPGGGAFGPNLLDGVTTRQFPDSADHEAFIMEGSDFEKPYGTRGIGSGRMPGFSRVLTEAQIKAIVAYERDLRGGRPVSVKQLIETGETGDTTTTSTTTGAAGDEVAS